MCQILSATYRTWLMSLGLALAWVACTHAEDWPQILGPHRNGISEETLPKAFPSGGLKAAWTAPIGDGYAGPVVADDLVVIFHRADGKERVQAFAAKEGKPKWSTDFPAHYRGGVDSDLGPRCTPVIASGKVYVFGAAGDLHCVKLADGAKVWSRSLYEDFDAPEGYFGAGSTPLVIGDVLLVNVGGKKAGLVGLDAATGETRWETTKELASYSSPTAFRRGDKERAIFITRMNVVEVDPEQGKTSVLFPFGRSGPTVNAAMPLIIGNDLFATSSYEVGAVLANIKTGTAKQIWANDESLSSQYSTPVHRDGYLYGIHGREDIPPAHLRCVELATGKVMWSRDDFGVAHPILAGDKLLLLTVAGEVVLAEASPKAYRELGRTRISKGVTRALPAFSNSRLYVRSQDRLYCFALGE